jgi:uncharacterized protein YqhQ
LPFLASESGEACPRAGYGGQAVLEGVMIRSPKALAVAVRRLDGRIVLKRESIVPLTKRHPLLNIPFIRGAFALADALITGMRALSFSADVAMEEENERAAAGDQGPGTGDGETGRRGDGESPGSEPVPRPTSPVPAEGTVEVRDVASGKGIPWWSLALTLMASMGIVVLFFVMLPDVVANLMRGRLPFGGASNVVINLAEGLLRVGLFVAYIAAISRMEAIGRVFQYHGAEHQVIHAFEKGEAVSVETASAYDTAHPRCGTSFIAVVVVVSILAFSFLDVHTWYVRQALKLALLPLVGGISYEVIRLAGAGKLTFLVTPGMWLQRLTTRRPTPDQVDVAIAALEGVLNQEGRSLNRAAEATGD